MFDASITNAVASIATLCRADAEDMYATLVGYAIKRLRCDEQEAHDIACDTVVYAIEREWSDVRWLTLRLKRLWLDKRSLAQSRQDRVLLDYDERNEPTRLGAIVSYASQDHDFRVNKLFAAINSLPSHIRPVMSLIAQEYTHEEAAKELGISARLVRIRATEGREALKRTLGEDVEKTKAKYKGVEKQGQKWRAKIMLKFEYGWKGVHVGLYDTAHEAAVAYDEAARRHLGRRAVLNFPDSVE